MYLTERQVVSHNLSNIEITCPPVRQFKSLATVTVQMTLLRYIQLAKRKSKDKAAFAIFIQPEAYHPQLWPSRQGRLSVSLDAQSCL